MMDNFKLILKKLDAIESKMDTILNSLYEQSEQGLNNLDFDGNAFGVERDQNSEL
jgi:hypothetical protein